MGRMQVKTTDDGADEDYVEPLRPVQNLKEEGECSAAAPRTTAPRDAGKTSR